MKKNKRRVLSQADVDKMLRSGRLASFKDTILENIVFPPITSLLNFRNAIQVVTGAPSEQKKGKWVKNTNGTWSCSLCHSWIPNEQHCYAKYCLHCGAELITPLCP